MGTNLHSQLYIHLACFTFKNFSLLQVVLNIFDMVNPNNQHKNPISHFTTKHTKYSIKVLRLVVVGLIIIKSFILLEYNMIPDITGMCIFFTLFLAAITAIFRYIFFWRGASEAPSAVTHAFLCALITFLLLTLYVWGMYVFSER